MATLDDMLTTAKNIVTAINGAAQSYLNVAGTSNAAGLTAATLVKTGAGRVATVSVIVAGSAVGKIYDANAATATTNPIDTIPMTVGPYTLNIAVKYGIVVAPGSGQTVTMGYS